MAVVARTAPQPPSLSIIRFLLGAVCAADIVLGLLILLVPHLLFRLFGIQPPEEMLWFQLIGMMLIPGAVDGLVGCLQPERYRWNVVVSACSRMMTGAFLLVVSTVREVPTVLVVIGCGEALVSLLGAYYIVRSGLLPTGRAPAPAVAG